jgi:hypothetical protein
MRPAILLIALMFFASVRPAAAETVDFLDYFIQKDDGAGPYTLSGKQVRQDKDPDGTNAKTYILNKGSSPNWFEVFKVTEDELQIRYEVTRHDGAAGTGNWIRRYEEINGQGKAPGELWAKRRVDVGGAPFLSRFHKDRAVFDDKTHSYLPDPKGSSPESKMYVSFEWATIDWGSNNKTGLDLSTVLRMTDEWQLEGKIFETYDYAKGKGLVNWRWLERVATLPKVPDDTGGQLFRCENGQVFVDWPDKLAPPRCWKYDAKSKRKTAQLEVTKFRSAWAPENGAEWYVIYRDLSREDPVILKRERIEHNFALPEWTSKPGATIADIPYVFTHRP